MGNLLLVSDSLNNKLKSKPFKEKKRILAENGYRVPPSIERADTWGPSEIRTRTEEIADLAYTKVWNP
jgi:hypothetical protein